MPRWPSLLGVRDYPEPELSHGKSQKEMRELRRQPKAMAKDTSYLLKLHTLTQFNPRDNSIKEVQFIISDLQIRKQRPKDIERLAQV